MPHSSPFLYRLSPDFFFFVNSNMLRVIHALQAKTTRDTLVIEQVGLLFMITREIVHQGELWESR